MPDATVIIITRNRREVAGRAVTSALAQDVDVEVLVIDDASDDNTSDYIQSAFPNVRVHRSPQRKGYIVHRNEGARLATGPFIISIDDDAEFGSTDTVRRAIAAFENERVGAVSLPHVDIVNGETRTPFRGAPDNESFWVIPAFVGTAYALRRETFLQLGGFETTLFHWNEEEELCRRLLGVGMICRAIQSPPIRHYPHPVGRHTRARNLFIFRNRVLVPWFTVPMPRLIGNLVYNTIGSIVQQITRPYSWLYTLEGLARGYCTILFHWPKRHPAPAAADRLYEELRGKRLVKFEEIADRLPPLAGPDSNIGVRSQG